MNADLEILEYPKILTELARQSETDRGKAAILGLKPSVNYHDIMTMLMEVEEAKTLIERYDVTPLNGVLDIDDVLKRSAKGGVLSAEELQNVVSHIEAENRTDRYLKKVRQLALPLEYLSPYYQQITNHQDLKQVIEDAIDPRGNIYDNASPELSSVRKKIAITEKRIQEKMNSLLTSEATRLTDSIITIRNNRLVLPVRADAKNMVKGIVHDQSASRETVFIEPLACVELNNDLQSLFSDEQDAIGRILYRLSQEVGLRSMEMLSNLQTFTSLDVIFAKAKHALEKNENMPKLGKEKINLINARHPFIPSDIVVPNTIAFKDYKSVVITGPNTGGKTVCLKTLGLLSLMVQSGMFIPADLGSETIVFDNILADIGDEQSIEQSLSTFSSHITKIISIIKKATQQSLILLDELGAGTDPKEGASLAISLLDYLRSVGCHAMVTTHYPELKVYAYNLDDVVNASVEFDIDSLKPTYRLKIGIPGTSNALEIAKRLGLDEKIIEEAKNVSLTFDNETTNLIKKLEQESRDLEAEINKAREMQADLLQKEATLKSEISQSRIKQNKIISELKEQKRVELEKAKEQAMELIKELDGMKKNANVKEHELANMKYKVKNMDTVEDEYRKVNQSKIQVGDLVNVIPYQRIGVVTKQRNDHEFEVQLGVLSAVFPEADLEYEKKADQTEMRSEVKVSKEGIIHAELDLRGKRYEEAMEELDKYVDDCLFHHLEFASIIHGYGTGALKKGVEEYIKTHKTIKKSRPGGQNEGGHGVTIIYFK